jgi:thymidylate kinase
MDKYKKNGCLIFEFSGMPKAGKSTIIELVATYLRRRGFDVLIHRDAAIDAPIDKDEIGALNSYLACDVVNSILSAEYNRNKYPRILILDRGIFDRCIFSNVLEDMGKIDEEENQNLKRFLLSKRYISLVKRVFLLVADEEDSLNRENKHSLVTTKGRVMNKTFLSCFRKNCFKLYEEIGSLFNSIEIIDTSKQDERQNETARLVARQMERDIELYCFKPAIEVGPVEKVDTYKLIGNVLVLEDFSEGNIGPFLVSFEGHEYYRYMDFFYSKKLPEQMTTSEAVEICDLRNQYLEYVVDKELNCHLIKTLIDFYKFLDVKDTPVVLDYGCGAGLSMENICDALPQHKEIRGIDASHDAIKRALAAGHKAYHISQYNKLNKQGFKFDLVLSIFVMHFRISVSDLTQLRLLANEGAIFLFNLYNFEVCDIENNLEKSGWSKPSEIDSLSLPGNHRLFYCVAS